MGQLGQCGEAEGALHAIGFRFEVHILLSEDLKKSLGFFYLSGIFFSSSTERMLFDNGRERISRRRDLALRWSGLA